jgi:DNA-directed RNA polymerase subunit RPC12/RpoP
MDSEKIESTQWRRLRIVCPYCGNRGLSRGEWRKNAPVPFKLVERVVRSFMFAGDVGPAGSISLLADVDTDEVDWESGDEMKLECMQCFGDFPVPHGVSVDFM